MKFEFLFLIILLAAAAWLAGPARWARATAKRQASLLETAVAVHPAAGGLEALPLPVQRYLRRALRGGVPAADFVRMSQEGSFNLSEDGERWAPFSASQVTALGEPAFDWDARVRVAPALTVFVRDSYRAGQGLTEARILGLWPVAEVRAGGGVAEAQLMRYLAEAAWYPMVLLPGGGVEWSEVDARSARAKMRHGPLQVSMVFTFAEDDSIVAVRAEARGRLRGGRLEAAPWQGRFWNYAYRSGLWIPLQGEVSWIMPRGPHPYWRGRVTEIRYERRP